VNTLKKWIGFICAIMGGLFGLQWSSSIVSTLELKPGTAAALFLVVMFVTASFSLGAGAAHYGMKLLKQSELSLSRIPLSDLLAAAFGLVTGLLVSVLLFPSLNRIVWLDPYFPLLVAAVLGIFGIRVGLGKKEEFAHLADKLRSGGSRAYSKEMEHKILDTSVIIDGRIADICKTGFIEGTLVIPEFVLEELQHIADSSDLLKRNRGRRGLDILNKIQKELDVKVLIYEGDFEDVSEVDSKLVKLAKVLGGKVITNDFNLNKVCELQGVPVLNINDLANAIKPVVLPGEEILVQVIKDGKEHGQGVAYLDDGTMIVVEGGRDFIGSMLEVLVTSVLQTSAGRMIFAKPKLLEKAQ
jgi:uncharacterized protein YacL